MPRLRLASAPKTSAHCRGDRRSRARQPEPRIPAEVLTPRRIGRHDVGQREPGDAEDRRLGERDHPSVGREEDEARRRDAEQERLGEDEAHPVVGEKGGADGDEDEDADTEAPLDDPLWTSSPSSSRPSDEPLRPEREHEREQGEGEDDRVVRVSGRQVHGRERVDEAVEKRSDGGAEERPEAADDDDDEGVQEPLPVRPRRCTRLGSANCAAEPRQRGTDEEGDGERPLDVDAERRGHLPVVDAGANDHAGPRPVEPQPEQGADRQPEAQHGEPRDRVLDAEEMEVDESLDRAGPRHGPTEAAVEVRDDLVGEDHRERDRDQRLTEVLTLVPAQEQDLLDDQAEDADRDGRDERRDHPLPRVDVRRQQGEAAPFGDPLLHVVRDVAAEQEERALRHVDHPHQPEDEGEAARDDEEQPGEGQAVQQGDEEVSRVVDRRPEVGRPPVATSQLVRRIGDHDHVEQREDDDPGRDGSRHGSYYSPGADSLGHRPCERTNVAGFDGIAPSAIVGLTANRRRA